MCPRLHEYVAKRGEGIWNHKWLDSPTGGAMRFKVLEAGGRRCALCGITSKDRALDVDHIVPHSKGGPSTFENLQILCSKCNRSKGNRSHTDFRVAEPPAPGYEDCAHCALPALKEFPSENDLARAVKVVKSGIRPFTSSPSVTSTVTWISRPMRSSPCTTCCALRWDGYMTVRSLRLGQMKSLTFLGSSNQGFEG